jgi:Mg/Co/Ni transporter MgtE
LFETFIRETSTLFSTVMLGTTILPEIRELIETRHFSELREVFSDMLPADIAEILVEIPEKDQAIVFRLLPRALATDVFEFLDFDSQKNLIKALGKEEVAAILDDMSAVSYTHLTLPLNKCSRFSRPKSAQRRNRFSAIRPIVSVA